MAQDQEAVDAAQTEYQEAAAAINGMADAQDSAADSAEDVAAALSAAQNNIQGIISAYNEAYDAALKSVSGQYDLWDTAEKIVATSASSINSALESQITYWDSYNQNLESLNARAADIDGLSAVIASFADGRKDSVNAIAGMASASDADHCKDGSELSGTAGGAENYQREHGRLRNRHEQRHGRDCAERGRQRGRHEPQ